MNTKAKPAKGAGQTPDVGSGTTPSSHNTTNGVLSQEHLDAQDWQAVISGLFPPDVADAATAHVARLMREKLMQGDGAPLQLLTSDQILHTDWPEPEWVIPDLLPVGLCIQAGKPKVGKSWLALQTLQAVASGGFVLDRQVKQGPVCYLALEDSRTRLKERMGKQHWPDGLPAHMMPVGEFQDQIGDFRNGGADILSRQIKAEGYRLVVIDTFSRACLVDQNDSQEVTAILTPLQELAHAHNCAIVLVDHHNKLGGNDAILSILGSTAKGAMADTIWGLYREQGKASAKLNVTGRDVVEITLELTMDWMTGVWQCEGDTDGLKLTENRQTILDAIEAMGQANLTELAEALERDRGNLYKELQNLVGVGLLKRTGKQKNTRYELL